MGREVSTQGFSVVLRGCVAAASYADAPPGTLHWLCANEGSRPTAPLSIQPGVGRVFMNAMRIVGVLLLVMGLAGFLTGGFNFTKDTTQAKIGPLELTVKEKETVNIPQWLSLGAMVLGGVVLVLGFRKN